MSDRKTGLFGLSWRSCLASSSTWEPSAGRPGIIAGVVAVYLLVTGLVTRCLVYRAAGIDTAIQEQPYSSTDDRAGL